MLKLIYLTLIFLFFTHAAHAYIGPGMGLGLIFSSLGFIFGFIAIFFGIIFYPIKKFLNDRRKKKNKVNN